MGVTLPKIILGGWGGGAVFIPACVLCSFNVPIVLDIVTTTIEKYVSNKQQLQ
jgi:hypothetical protein